MLWSRSTEVAKWCSSFGRTAKLSSTFARSRVWAFLCNEKRPENVNGVVRRSAVEQKPQTILVFPHCKKKPTARITWRRQSLKQGIARQERCRLCLGRVGRASFFTKQSATPLRVTRCKRGSRCSKTRSVP